MSTSASDLGKFMNARHVLLATLLFASTLAPTVALAQSSDADKATARDLALEGYKALQAKDYAAAVDRFTRADALYHAPTVTLGLARAQVGLGKLVSAQELYSRITHETLPPNATTGIKKAVVDAQKELNALAPRIPSVVINVKGSDAPRVTLDGIEVRAAALGVKRPVDPGKHVILASAPGFAADEVTVSLAEGKSESVTIELKPRQAEPPPVVAVAPAVKPPTATPALMTPAPPEPDQIKGNGSTRKTIAFVALGVGAAGLLVGSITGGLALSKHSDITISCPEGHCPKGQQAIFDPAIDRYNTMGAISTIGFLAGGALAATGVVLMLTAPKKMTTQATVTPLIGLGFVGATGSF
ncbi:MAG: hypothetical protein ACMG6S_25395 [Byssovorax sp.]